MSIKRLIWQSLKKNIRSYYLYVFALTFSVALYFAFVTLQFDPALDTMSGTAKGSAGIYAGSVLLIAIVTVFLLYANNLFIKRRSKEIGLFQLIGMTKGKIFRILSIENSVLYAGSIVIGIFLGFAGSKLIKLIFFQITGIDQVAALNFSAKATGQTLLVFLIIYLFIMVMNYLFINRQSVLSLFQIRSKSENVKKMSIMQILIGIIGIGLIMTGYYLSTKLFSGDIDNQLFFAMLSILGSVIIGTYLFFKGSVSFILQLIRKSKAGYLSINNVLSLSSIMFRMKSNAVLLTVITTVSALAIGLLSLTYISYYSMGKSAQQIAPNDFSLTDADDADSFMEELNAEQIGYEETRIDFITVRADITDALESALSNFNGELENTRIVVVSDQATADINVSLDEAALTGVGGSISQFLSFQEEGNITLSSQTSTILQ
ncbi:FtsX-like permease family protein [Lentibacillus sp. CBA3610]|uniref:FtsX-like permease family protein n=1 Tax=Lentibacillus sp. CBA3610 TaxID=2518176 RepID=UPI0026EA3F73|nr:ABC transporter permease [Lentibacillus sp. CBA3610]